MLDLTTLNLVLPINEVLKLCTPLHKYGSCSHHQHLKLLTDISINQYIYKNTQDIASKLNQYIYKNTQDITSKHKNVRNMSPDLEEAVSYVRDLESLLVRSGVLFVSEQTSHQDSE